VPRRTAPKNDELGGVLVESIDGRAPGGWGGLSDAPVRELLRQRALAADLHALRLGFRTIRGSAKPVDMTPVKEPTEQ
jgi:hypothetical protein